MRESNSLLCKLYTFLVVGCLFTCTILVNDLGSSFGLRYRKIDVHVWKKSSFLRLEISDTGETKRFPKAIIIGAKKCGTDAIIEFINIHPMVRVHHGEPHFFDKDKNYDRGYGSYLNRLPSSFPDQITIEKSPAYFPTPAVPLRMREMFPGMKIILVVRDPVVRSVSDYVHTEHVLKTKLPPFEELAIDKSTGHVNESWDPIVIGRYALHFSRWLEYFPRNQILVLSGERLIANPMTEVKKVETFLGLDPLIEEDHFVFNKTKGFMCFKNFSKTRSTCFNKSKGSKHPQVDSLVLQKLNDFYKPLNEEFYNLVGENFGWSSDSKSS